MLQCSAGRRCRTKLSSQCTEHSTFRLVSQVKKLEPQSFRLNFSHTQSVGTDNELITYKIFYKLNWKLWKQNPGNIRVLSACYFRSKLIFFSSFITQSYKRYLLFLQTQPLISSGHQGTTSFWQCYQKVLLFSSQNYFHSVRNDMTSQQ